MTYDELKKEFEAKCAIILNELSNDTETSAQIEKFKTYLEKIESQWKEYSDSSLISTLYLFRLNSTVSEFDSWQQTIKINKNTIAFAELCSSLLNKAQALEGDSKFDNSSFFLSENNKILARNEVKRIATQLENRIKRYLANMYDEKSKLITKNKSIFQAQTKVLNFQMQSFESNFKSAYESDLRVAIKNCIEPLDALKAASAELKNELSLATQSQSKITMRISDNQEIYPYRELAIKFKSLVDSFDKEIETKESELKKMKEQIDAKNNSGENPQSLGQNKLSTLQWDVASDKTDSENKTMNASQDYQLKKLG